MAEYRTIEVDFEVHKAIEVERRSFDERANDVLRRLLRLPENPADKLRNNEPGITVDDQIDALGEGAAWRGKGVVLPNGTKVRMEYNGTLYQGEIKGGRWDVGGQIFKTPSAAAGALAMTRNGTRTKLNGWIYWEVLKPGEQRWVKLEQLRPREYEKTNPYTLDYF